MASLLWVGVSVLARHALHASRNIHTWRACTLVLVPLNPWIYIDYGLPNLGFVQNGSYKRWASHFLPKKDMMPRWSFAVDLLEPRLAAGAVGLDSFAPFAVPGFPAVATPLPASACLLEPIKDAVLNMLYWTTWFREGTKLFSLTQERTTYSADTRWIW